MTSVQYDRNTKIGRLWKDPAARDVIVKYVDIPPEHFELIKGFSLATLAGYTDETWLEPLVAEQVLSLPQPLEDGARDLVRQQALAPSDRPDGAQERVSLDLLQDVPGRPRQDRCEHGLVVGERGQHEHAGAGQQAPDLARRFDAAPVDEPDVHDHHIGARPLGFGDRVADRSSLRDHPQVLGGGEQLHEAAPDDLVVVDQHHAYAQRIFGHGLLASCRRLGDQSIGSFREEGSRGRKSRRREPCARRPPRRVRLPAR